MLTGWHFKWTGIQGPLLLALIKFNPITDNYIHYKVWDEITYILPNFNGATTEVGEWISKFYPTSYLACDYLSTLGCQFIHVSKTAPMALILVEISLKFPYDPINNDPAMVRITIIDKWLSEPMVA